MKNYYKYFLHIVTLFINLIIRVFVFVRYYLKANLPVKKSFIS
jgi:hypothetical protein